MQPNSQGDPEAAVDTQFNPSDEPPDYTGVVVIHGIGEEARNDTLLEALNAVSYWLNHEVGLQYRQTGQNRIWLKTHLGDDPDPDAQASYAKMLLQAPGSDSVLRVDMSEVWWAESFGLPSAGETLRWAWLQFWQVAGRKLSPSMMLTQPRSIFERRNQPPGDDGEQSPGDEELYTGRGHLLLRMVVGTYDAIQRVWKLGTWALGSPLVVLLLLAAILVQKLAGIPGFPSLLRGLQKLITLVSLHWIGSMLVYMQDYTRSTSIRQRFQGELEKFLDDDNCRRVVVIAHSMGTVVAYEGLTTALEVRADPQKDKISFVCLAPAFRRLWRFTRNDPHRLRSVLPKTVDWYDFWAHFDPVPAGPLTSNAVPNARDWTDGQDPYQAICDRLQTVTHVAVANRDSVLFDHTTYWENVEQVVGPIACMLVEGDAALTELTRKKLATNLDLLRRVARIALRAGSAIAAGAVALVVIGWVLPHTTWGLAILSAVGGFLGGLLGPLGVFFGNIGAWIVHVSGGTGLPAALAGALYALLTVAPRVIEAVLAAGLAVYVVSNALLRSPYRFYGPRHRLPTAAPPKGGKRARKQRDLAHVGAEHHQNTRHQ